MIDIPNTESVESVADWVELVLATQFDLISKTSLTTMLEMSSGSEPSETFVSSIWRELEYRKSLYSFSVFEIGERSISNSLDVSRKNIYLICLLLSLFGVQGNTKTSGKIFERLTTEAVKKYLNGEAIVFGWPFEGSKDAEETLLTQKVRKLATDLSEKFSEAPLSRYKDRGLDVVGWIPNSDKRSSQVVLLLQCAAGHNWTDKLPVPLDSWGQYIHWAANPVRAFAVPCVINEQIWHDSSREKGVLFDRVRILNLLSEEAIEKELKDAIDNWVQVELSDREI